MKEMAWLARPPHLSVDLTTLQKNHYEKLTLVPGCFPFYGPGL